MQPIIVRRNGNQFIPNAYLELLLTTHSSAWSCAMVNTDGDQKEIMVSRGDGDGLSVKLIQETMEACPADDLIFCFYASDKALNLDDINPHVLLKNGDETKIIGFVVGDYPGFDQPTSSKPSSYFFAHNYLKPKFEMLSELCDGNLEKIVTAFNKPNFKQDALNNAPSHGVITLMVQDCTQTTFAKTDSSAEYPWGWVSDNLGYAMAKKEPAKEVKQEKRGMFPSKSTVREKAVTTPAAPEPKPAAVDAVTAAAEALKANALENYKSEKRRAPATLSRKERNKWFKNRIGYLPEGWDQGIGPEVSVWLDPKGQIMTINDVKRLGLKALPMLPKAKDTETENISHGQMDNAPAAGEKVTAELLPIMSPKAREVLTAYLKDAKVQKKIAANATVIEDPTHVQQIEAKFASFNAQMGHKDMSDFLKWDLQMFKDIVWPVYNEEGKQTNPAWNPEAAYVMLWTFRNIIAGNEARKAKKVEAAVETHVIAKEELQPERRGMFPKKKVA